VHPNKTPPQNWLRPNDGGSGPRMLIKTTKVLMRKQKNKNPCSIISKRVDEDRFIPNLISDKKEDSQENNNKRSIRQR
jgi:hypothetical protein